MKNSGKREKIGNNSILVFVADEHPLARGHFSASHQLLLINIDWIVKPLRPEAPFALASLFVSSQSVEVYGIQAVQGLDLRHVYVVRTASVRCQPPML